MIRGLFNRLGFHPGLWWNRLFTYPRFMGHVWHKLIEGGELEFQWRRKFLAPAWTPAELTVPIGRRILALSPHADDESIGAGGLLLAHRGLAELHVVVVTDGARGGALPDGEPLDPDSARLVDVRRGEMERAASRLGAASLEFLGLPDGAVPDDEATVTVLRKVLHHIRPDVVLIPWILDAHPDHRQVNRLFARASDGLDCMVIGYEIWSLLEPNAWFDITDHLEAKLGLIDCFESQLRTVDYCGYAQCLARVRAYHGSRARNLGAAREAFVALPSREYRLLVERLLLSTVNAGTRPAEAAQLTPKCT